MIVLIVIRMSIRVVLFCAKRYSDVERLSNWQLHEPMLWQLQGCGEGTSNACSLWLGWTQLCHHIFTSCYTDASGYANQLPDSICYTARMALCHQSHFLPAECLYCFNCFIVNTTFIIFISVTVTIFIGCSFYGRKFHHEKHRKFAFTAEILSNENTNPKRPLGRLTWP